jgi:signal peptidase I
MEIKKSILRLVVVGIVVGFALKFFVFEIFTVPTDSMTPTIAVGSKVVLNKLFFGNIKRGDVMCFERQNTYFVKRITGLPNEKMAYANGRYALGAAAESATFTIPQKGTTVALDAQNYDVYAPLISEYEGVPVGKVLSKIYINNSESNIYTFTQAYFFLEGDNTATAIDSRDWGLIGASKIKGKVWY